MKRMLLLISVLCLSQYYTTVKAMEVTLRIRDQIKTAIAGNNIEQVKELLAMRANPNMWLLSGTRPLVLAAQQLKDTKMSELLLNAGAAPNQGDEFGFSPLRWAIINHNLPLAKLLLDHNAKITEADLSKMKETKKRFEPTEELSKESRETYETYINPLFELMKNRYIQQKEQEHVERARAMRAFETGLMHPRTRALAVPSAQDLPREVFEEIGEYVTEPHN